MWTWDKGRQIGGYEKLLIAQSKWLKFDLYLLRFPVGSQVPLHRDPSLPGFEHHRVNITINKPCIGTGEVFVAGPFKSWMNGRIMKFRPDLYFHHMSKVDFIWSRSMYMISFGWLTKSKGTTCP